MKSFFKWTDGLVHKMRWFDVSMIKMSSLAFGLLLAKLFPGILSLEWYWYLGLSLVFALYPLRHMLTK